MSDVSGVLDRIASIQARLAAGAPAASVAALPTPDAPGAAGFAALLASVTASGPLGAAQAGASTADAAPTGAALAADAQRYLGVPYQWGGTDPATGLDCSGLVQRAAADLGISLPRTSQQQAQAGTPVASLADAQPGDLVFFAGSDGTPSAPGHVGIYLGDGQMIDAPHTGAAVRIEAVGTPVAIRRVVGDATTSPFGTADRTFVAATDRPAALGGGAYAADFAQAAAAHGVPAALLASVARAESGYDPNAVSAAGAQGLMQLMPSTAAGFGADPFDPAQAIDAAARLLAADRARFGSWRLALAAYNAGPEAVASAGGVPDYPETQQYVAKVLAGAGMEATA